MPVFSESLIVPSSAKDLRVGSVVSAISPTTRGLVQGVVSRVNGEGVNDVSVCVEGGDLDSPSHGFTCPLGKIITCIQ